MGFTVCTLVLQHNLTGPIRMFRVKLTYVSLLCLLSSISFNAQNSLWSSSLCPRETRVLFHRKLQFSFIIQVMVTTSDPFLPGECSRVYRKLLSSKRVAFIIYQNIYDLDLKSY